MKFIEINIDTSQEKLDELTDSLVQAGWGVMDIRDPAMSRAMSEDLRNAEYWDSPDLERQLAQTPGASIYFEDGPAGEEEARGLQELLEKWNRGEPGTGGLPVGNGLAGCLKVSRTVIDDADWKDKWKAGLKPVAVSDHITVSPPWIDYEPAEDERVIWIEPGMAFGTGTHETTSLCAALLDHYISDAGEPERLKVMDVGCGTGILSIMARYLGAGEVLGIDIDPEAVRTARENVAKNLCTDGSGRASGIEIREGDLTRGVSYRADIIVANLLAPLIEALTPDATAHLSAGGVYIVSGVLVSQEKEVTEALEESGFTVEITREKNQWCAMAARLNDKK